jgi:hypothetical protein
MTSDSWTRLPRVETSHLFKTKLTTANRKPHEKAASCSINVNAVGLIQYRARHSTKIGNSQEDSCNPLGVASDRRCENKTSPVADLQSRQTRLAASNPIQISPSFIFLYQSDLHNLVGHKPQATRRYGLLRYKAEVYRRDMSREVILTSP